MCAGRRGEEERGADRGGIQRARRCSEEKSHVWKSSLPASKWGRREEGGGGGGTGASPLYLLV